MSPVVVIADPGNVGAVSVDSMGEVLVERYKSSGTSVVVVVVGHGPRFATVIGWDECRN